MDKKISVNSYITGFVLSLVLTLVAYSLVWRYVQSNYTLYTDKFLLISVAALAITQLLVQLVFFLHLSRESKPRWNLAVLSFAVLIVVILVFGSLWIMWNLDYHHASEITPAETDKYIIEDEGIRD